MSGADTITGRAFKYGDNVNTDVIFPGKYTYTLSDPEEIAKHALEDLDPTFVSRVAAGDVVVAGRNFGCGSSRESAVTCLVHNRVGAVIAASFSRIFYRNAINNGLLAIACPAAAAAIEDGDRVEIGLAGRTITVGEQRFDFPPMSATVREIVAAGGLIPWAQQRMAR